MQRDREYSRLPFRRQSIASSPIPSSTSPVSPPPPPPPSAATTAATPPLPSHLEQLRHQQRQQNQHRPHRHHRHSYHYHQQPSRQGPGHVAPRPPSTSPPAGRRRPGTAPTSVQFTPGTPASTSEASTTTPASAARGAPPSASMSRSRRPAPLSLGSSNAAGSFTASTAAAVMASPPPPASASSVGRATSTPPHSSRTGSGTSSRMRSSSNASTGGPMPSPLLTSPTTVTQSPAGYPFSPATTMPIVQHQHDTGGAGAGTASVATQARNGPVSPGIPTLVSVPSLGTPSRTSFQPLQDPRGPARSQPLPTPKYQQRRDRHAQHHRSASWCSGEEEEAFAKTPFRFTPTRDCSVSPRSTPSPGMATDGYTSGFSPRYPSTSPARGGSRTTRASPRAATPPDLSGDRCERLRFELGEMLLQNELDNLTAHQVRSRMTGGEESAECVADDGTAKNDDDVEKYNDGRSPGDAKVLAKRQPSRTPAVFLPVSATEHS